MEKIKALVSRKDYGVYLFQNTIWSNGKTKQTKTKEVIELCKTTKINKIIEQLEVVKELDNKALAPFTDCFCFYSFETKEESIKRLVNKLKRIVLIYETNDLEEVEQKYLEYVDDYDRDNIICFDDEMIQKYFKGD